MSYTPSYTKRNYVNNQAPSLNADNLNAIEDAITNLESNAQSYSSKVDTLQNTSATKTELNIAKRELSEDIAFANRAIADEIEAREASEAEIRTEISKVANSNLQTSSDVLDFAMHGNIQSARFEGYARKSKNLLDCNGFTTRTISGVTFTPKHNENGQLEYISLSGTASADIKLSLAQFLCKANINSKLIGADKSASWTTYSLRFGEGALADIGNGVVVNPSSDTNYTITLYVNKNASFNNTIVKPMITTDTSLTYNDYEPYGIIKPSGIVKSKSGDNMLDISKCTIGKALAENGTETDNTAFMITDFIPIKKNTRYYFLGSRADDGYGERTLRFHLFKSNKVWDSQIAILTASYGNVKHDFVASADGYLRISLISTYTNLQIADEDIPYTPFRKSEITLPYIPLGVGDIHDELIVNADGSGKFIKRIGTVDMGSLNWSASPTSDSTKYRMRTETISEIKNISASQVGNMLCEKYDNVSSENIYNRQDVGISTNSQVLIAYDTNYNQSVSASSFKSAMNGIILYYELATEQTINLTALQVAQILALKTFADTTYIDADGMHYEIGYAQNSAKAIKELQNIIKNLLNPQEVAMALEEDNEVDE